MPFVHGVCTISSATNGITDGDFNEVKMLTTKWGLHSGIWRCAKWVVLCATSDTFDWENMGKKPLDAFKPSDDDKCGNLAVGFVQPLYSHAYNPQKWRFPLFKHQMEVFSRENRWKSSRFMETFFPEKFPFFNGGSFPWLKTSINLSVMSHDVLQSLRHEVLYRGRCRGRHFPQDSFHLWRGSMFF